MKTIDIKGKAYVQVNERILYFKNNFDGSIVTELLSNEGGVCIFKADIFVEGILRATGHAYEKEGSTFINKTSYIENCETSAVGRALGLLGIGIETSVATAEEVGNAIKQQEQTKEKKKKKSADLEPFLDEEAKKGTLKRTWEDNKDRWEKILEKPEWNKIKAYYTQLKATFKESDSYQCPIPGAGMATIEECKGQDCPELLSCKPYQSKLSEKV